jgi:hypothetical protein
MVLVVRVAGYDGRVMGNRSKLATLKERLARFLCGLHHALGELVVMKQRCMS